MIMIVLMDINNENKNNILQYEYYRIIAHDNFTTEDAVSSQKLLLIFFEC